ALLQLGQLDEAQRELEFVLQYATQNLAAIRALAELHHRRGAIPDAIAQYKAALLLAPNDPELERTIAELSDSLTRSADARDNVRALALVAALNQWLIAVHVT